MKPLVYLREGTVYIFEIPAAEPSDPTSHRLEHYWLCGQCAATHRLERTANRELRLVPKESLRFVRRRTPVADSSQALAS